MQFIYPILLFLAAATIAQAAVMKKMKIKRMSSSDLDASASGYIYTAASGQPTSYVQFSSNTASLPVQQYQHVVPLVQYYVAKQEPEPLIVEPVEEIQEPVEEIKQDYAVADNSQGFEKSGGEEYGKAHHSAHGEKGSKGYENKDSYNKGQKGEHAQEQDAGYYKENGGKKSGHYDSAGHYNKHHAEGHGSKGQESGEKSSHKKGQKTTGYHNVYHKDEYKKDHTFYDEADRNGFYKKYGDHEQHHSKENGGHTKGGKHDSGHHSDDYGKKGSHDKGYYDNEDAGFKKQKGHEAHHENYADYAKEGGNKAGSGYGYEDGSEEKY